MKRLISCTYNDLRLFSKTDKLNSIRDSDGRVMLVEISLSKKSSVIDGVTDAELAAAFSADIILLNEFDLEHTSIPEIDIDTNNPIKRLKDLVGKMIGVNLEPYSNDDKLANKVFIPKGRRATIENVKKLKQLGVDLIVLTGNPNTGVSQESLKNSIKNLNIDKSDSMIYGIGKMHSAGIQEDLGENFLKNEDIEAYAKYGADIVLLPAPATVPGISIEWVSEKIRFIHKHNMLSLTTIATSQEGADTATIRDIALMCKMTGTDIHHIGDAGLGGLVPENLLTYSVAIRGKRHTYAIMARSLNR